jgi:hypothetical protein
MLLRRIQTQRNAIRAAAACLIVAAAIPLIPRFAPVSSDFVNGLFDGARVGVLLCAVLFARRAVILRRGAGG